MNMNKKNKIIISITGIVLVLLILVGLTYGYYLTRISGNTSDKSISIDMANLELTYSDGNGLIEAKSIIPGETIATKTFTVKNTGNAKISNYVVYLDSVVNNFEDKNDLKLTLTCTSDIGNCNGTNITYPSTNTMLVTNDIEEKETQSFELKVEFIETNDDQSDNMNKEMSGNILIKDIKGLNSTLETVTGTNNLVVENAKLLSNYRIYGNSVQNGTPSIDTPVEIKSVGDLVTDTNDVNYGKYKISIKLVGENKFDNNNIESGTINSTTGVLESTTTSSRSINYIEVKPNTYYLLNSLQGNIRIHYYDINKKWLYSDVKTNNEKIFSNEKTYYIKYSKGTNVNTIKTYNIELNEVIQILNIYLDEPLRKIDDYSDYIDFKTGKVYRKIIGVSVPLETLLLTNSTSIDMTRLISSYNPLLANNNYISTNNSKDIFNCNVIKYGQTEALHWLGGNKYISLFAPINYTIASYFETIKDKIPSGFSLIYVNKDVIENKINLPNAILNTKTKIVKIDTETKPSNTEIEYIK